MAINRPPAKKHGSDDSADDSAAILANAVYKINRNKKLYPASSLPAPTIDYAPFKSKLDSKLPNPTEFKALSNDQKNTLQENLHKAMEGEVRSWCNGGLDETERADANQRWKNSWDDTVATQIKNTYGPLIEQAKKEAKAADAKADPDTNPKVKALVDERDKMQKQLSDNGAFTEAIKLAKEEIANRQLTNSTALAYRARKEDHEVGVLTKVYKSKEQEDIARETARINAKYDPQIKEIEAKYDQDIGEISATFDQQIVNINATYDQEIAKINSKYTELDFKLKMKAELEEPFNNQIKAEQKRHDDRIINIDKESQPAKIDEHYKKYKENPNNILSREQFEITFKANASDQRKKINETFQARKKEIEAEREQKVAYITEYLNKKDENGQTLTEARDREVNAYLNQTTANGKTNAENRATEIANKQTEKADKIANIQTAKGNEIAAKRTEKDAEITNKKDEISHIYDKKRAGVRTALNDNNTWKPYVGPNATDAEQAAKLQEFKDKGIIKQHGDSTKFKDLPAGMYYRDVREYKKDINGNYILDANKDPQIERISRFVLYKDRNQNVTSGPVYDITDLYRNSKGEITPSPASGKDIVEKLGKKHWWEFPLSPLHRLDEKHAAVISLYASTGAHRLVFDYDNMANFNIDEIKGVLESSYREGISMRLSDQICKRLRDMGHEGLAILKRRDEVEAHAAEIHTDVKEERALKGCKSALKALNEEKPDASAKERIANLKNAMEALKYANTVDPQGDALAKSYRDLLTKYDQKREELRKLVAEGKLTLDDTDRAQLAILDADRKALKEAAPLSKLEADKQATPATIQPGAAMAPEVQSTLSQAFVSPQEKLEGLIKSLDTLLKANPPASKEDLQRAFNEILTAMKNTANIPVEDTLAMLNLLLESAAKGNLSPQALASIKDQVEKMQDRIREQLGANVITHKDMLTKIEGGLTKLEQIQQAIGNLTTQLASLDNNKNLTQIGNSLDALQTFVATPIEAKMTIQALEKITSSLEEAVKANPNLATSDEYLKTLEKLQETRSTLAENLANANKLDAETSQQLKSLGDQFNKVAQAGIPLAEQLQQLPADKQADKISKKLAEIGELMEKSPVDIDQCYKSLAVISDALKTVSGKLEEEDKPKFYDAVNKLTELDNSLAGKVMQEANKSGNKIKESHASAMETVEINRIQIDKNIQTSNPQFKV